MIVHIWSVLCSKALIDNVNNNVSLLEVREQLNIVVPTLPLPGGSALLIPETCDLVSLWSRDDNDQPSRGQGQIILLKPSGERAVPEPISYEIDLSAHPRTRMVTRIGGFPVTESGRYNFHVQYRNDGETEWRDAAKIPLQVTIETPPSSPQSG